MQKIYMNYIHVHLIFISSVWSVEALQWLYIFIYSQGTPQARTYLCQCVGTLIHLKWPARGSMCTLDFPRMIKTFMNIQELDFNFKYLVSLQIKYTWLICIKMFNVFMNFITLFSKTTHEWIQFIVDWFGLLQKIHLALRTGESYLPQNATKSWQTQGMDWLGLMPKSTVDTACPI